MEKPAGKKNMGKWTANVYTLEQQARLGLNENGLKVNRKTAAAMVASNPFAAAGAGAGASFGSGFGGNAILAGAKAVKGGKACHFFTSGKVCRAGAKCKFEHPAGGGGGGVHGASAGASAGGMAVGNAVGGTAAKGGGRPCHFFAAGKICTDSFSRSITLCF